MNTLLDDPDALDNIYNEFVFQQICSHLEEKNIADEEFANIFLLVLYSDKDGARALTIMNTFGVTRGTLSRWINGTAVPHSGMRMPILELLRDIVQK